MFRPHPAGLAIHPMAAARQYIFCGMSGSRLVSFWNGRANTACGAALRRLTLDRLSFCFDITLAFNP